jgi:alkylhydroperoxidase family enzyme
MPLLPTIEESGQAAPDLIARIKSERGGRLLTLYKVLLNSEPIADGWLRLFTAIRQRTILDGSIREIAILRIAAINNALYEFEAHRPFALQEGVPEDWLEDIKAGRIPAGADERTHAVINYTDALTRDATVSQAAHDQVRAYLSEREMLEFVVTVAAYNMVSRVLNALRIEHEET